MELKFTGDEFTNLAIGWGADSRGVFCPLITDCVSDLHFAGGVSTQCFPLFLYELVEEVDTPKQQEMNQAKVSKFNSLILW